jgi:ribonuclease T1
MLSRGISLTVIALVAGLLLPPGATAFERGAAGGGLKTMLVSELPPEGRQTLALIRQGGPFPYPAKDGSTFSNREQRLAKQPRGYYREYTVKTPGSRDRGARRIICGGKAQLECFYTNDHYNSFRLIKE